VMDKSAIIEHTVPDPEGGLGGYLMTFNGMVGFAHDHPDRTVVDKMVDQEIEYDFELVHDENGRVAVENTDYRIVERPRGVAKKLT